MSVNVWSAAGMQEEVKWGRRGLRKCGEFASTYDLNIFAFSNYRSTAELGRNPGLNCCREDEALSEGNQG